MRFDRRAHADGKDRGLQLSETLEFIFRRRYNLPPTDPRFLDLTLEDMILDYWAHRHADDPNLRNEVVAEGFEEDAAEMLAESMAKQPDDPDDWEDI